MSYATESDISVKSYDHSNLSKASTVQFRASRHIISPNLTFVWKGMTIWISWELPLFIFERLDILCAWIGPRVKSYDHLNISRASVVQFRASLYVMRLNRTSEWKVMTIWFSQELPLLNFERLDIFYSCIGFPCEKLWLFKFLESFRCSLSRV